MMRQQITDVVTKLILLAAEQSKLWHENANNKLEFHVVGMHKIINQQRSSFARQAIYLIEQVPSLVSDIEYATVADALAGIGDVPRAEAFYLEAIKNSKHRIYKIWNIRSYARFLYDNNRYEEGRKYYREALLIFDGNDSENFDYVKGENVHTYLYWAEMEARALLLKEAEELYNHGRSIAEEIVKSDLREMLLGMLARSARYSLKKSEEKL